MKKWLRQHLNITVVFTLISIIAMGIACAAVQYSDVQTLKGDVRTLKEKSAELPERLGRLEQKTDDIKESVYRIEGMIAQ